jgi:hypothetical protein
MAYVDQFDGLVRAQDAGRSIRSLRTMAVFGDGIVICTIDGVWQQVGRVLLPFFQHRGLLEPALVLTRPSQQVVGRREAAIKNQAMRLAAAGTAASFARTRRRALAISFADVTAIVLASTREGRLLDVQVISADGGQQAYSYLNDLPTDLVREVLRPLIGDRLMVHAPLATATFASPYPCATLKDFAPGLHLIGTVRSRHQCCAGSSATRCEPGFG